MKTSYISKELETLIWPLYSKRLKSKDSKKMYWSDIIGFCNIVKKDLLDITEEDVELFYRYYTKESPVKLATLQKKFRELSAFSDFIAENALELLGESFFQNLFSSRLEEINAQVHMAKGHIPTVQEMDKLLQLAEKNNLMHYAIFSLIYRCAIRPSELIVIKPSDFIRNPEGLYLRIGEKKKERVIPLPDDMTTIIEQYEQVRKKSIAYFFYNDTFQTLRQLSERTLERLAQEYAQKANISPITMYGIRDASIALMCSCGAPASYIARDSGITEIAVERYRQLVPTYTLKDSAINLMRIRILPYGFNEV